MLKNELKKLNELKKRNKKIVLCHGVFDILHIGHLKYFEQAKKTEIFWLYLSQVINM